MITFPEAVTEAVLRPPSVADAGTAFERLRPTAIAVQVTADGQVQAVPDGPLSSEVTIRWASPARHVELRYRLTQASVVSAPAKAGRMLGAVGPLVGRLPGDLPVTVVVVGTTVRSISCPQLPLAQAACAAGAAPQFRTERPIPYDRSRVLVQYDRPARR